MDEERKDMTMKKLKLYEVTVKNRYYPMEGERKVRMWAESKSDARDRLWCAMHTDEYRYVKATEVKG